MAPRHTERGTERGRSGDVYGRRGQLAHKTAADQSDQEAAN